MLLFYGEGEGDGGKLMGKIRGWTAKVLGELLIKYTSLHVSRERLSHRSCYTQPQNNIEIYIAYIF